MVNESPFATPHRPSLEIGRVSSHCPITFFVKKSVASIVSKWHSMKSCQVRGRVCRPEERRKAARQASNILLGPYSELGTALAVCCCEITQLMGRPRSRHVRTRHAAYNDFTPSLMAPLPGFTWGISQHFAHFTGTAGRILWWHTTSGQTMAVAQTQGVAGRFRFGKKPAPIVAGLNAAAATCGSTLASQVLVAHRAAQSFRQGRRSVTAGYRVSGVLLRDNPKVATSHDGWWANEDRVAAQSPGLAHPNRISVVGVVSMPLTFDGWRHVRHKTSPLSESRLSQTNSHLGRPLPCLWVAGMLLLHNMVRN